MELRGPGRCVVLPGLGTVGRVQALVWARQGCSQQHTDCYAGSQPPAPRAEVRCLQPLREGKRGRGTREQEDEMAPSGHLIGPKQANRKTNKTSGLETEVVFIFWLWMVTCALFL